MGIVKKECRKYAVKKLTISSNNGMLMIDDVRHIVTASVRNIAGSRVLILFFYNRERIVTEGNYFPSSVIFHSKDDYTTLVFCDDGKTKWRSGAYDRYEYSLSNYRRTHREDFFADKRDCDKVTRFFHNGKEGFAALIQMQHEIKAARLHAKRLKAQKNTMQYMKRVPSLPRNFKNWAAKNALPSYIFYEYHKGKKPMHGFCTACHHTVQVTGAKHKKDGTCPRCKAQITYMATRKTGRNLRDRKTVSILQKTGDNEILLRNFKLYGSYRDQNNPEYTLWESNRYFIKTDISAGKQYLEYYYDPKKYGDKMLNGWHKGPRPFPGSYYYYSFLHDDSGVLYTDNLSHALEGTFWQYSQIQQYANHLLSHDVEFDCLDYLNAFHNYPFLEYLIKLKLYQLACDLVNSRPSEAEKIINKDGKTLQEILLVPPQSVPLMQEIGVGLYELSILQAFYENMRLPDKDSVLWCCEKFKAHKADLSETLKVVGFTKLQHYLEKQKTTGKLLERLFTTYHDYISMAQGLEYDMKNPFVLFPKNIEKAHNDVVKKSKRMTQSRYKEKIRKMYLPLYQQYYFEDGSYFIVPPKNSAELTKEGHTLHHCAATYPKFIAEGRCLVFFVRRKADPATPYFTVDLRADKIVQVEGKNRVKPDDDVSAFLKKWQAEKLQQKSQQKILNAA